MNYSKEDCIESLLQAQEMVDGTLGANDYRELDLSPSVKTIAKKFGGWNEAKEQAKLETTRIGGNSLSYVPYWTCKGKDAYEVWQHKYKTQRDTVRVHRLLAVAEFGFDKVKEMSVHHQSIIPWDNRPENIELMTKSQHQSYHRSIEA